MDIEFTGFSAEKNLHDTMDNELPTQSDSKTEFDNRLITQLEKLSFPADSKAKLFQDHFWTESCFENETSRRKSRYYSVNNIELDGFLGQTTQSSEHGLFACQKPDNLSMDEEKDRGQAQEKTHKKPTRLVTQIQDLLKTKPLRKNMKSGEKDGIVTTKFELDSGSDEKNGRKQAKLAHEGGLPINGDCPYLDPLHSRNDLLSGSNSEVNLNYVSNANLQINLRNPDIGQNKFLKSPHQQVDFNLSDKKEVAKEKIHHFGIMRLLNSVENVNIESNLPKSKETDSLAMLVELEKTKKDRYQKTVLTSLADRTYYWTHNSGLGEPKSPIKNNFDLPILAKGSGSFVGRIGISRNGVPAVRAQQVAIIKA